MSRLADLRIVDPLLSQFAIGYSNPAFIGSRIFPFVRTAKETGKYPIFGKEAFELHDTRRAVRAKPKRGDWTLTSGSFVLDEHILEFAIDKREREEAVNPIQPERRNVFLSMEAARLRLEYDQAALAFGATNYATGNKATLTGNDRWSVAHADSQPILDVRAAKEAVRAKIGRKPNTMVVGAKTFRYLQDHSTIIERIKYSERAIITEEMLAAIFEVETFLVGEAVYTTAEGTTFTDIWGAHAALMWVPPTDVLEMDMMTPAFGKTFRKLGQPEAGRFAEPPRLDVVWASDIFKPYVTSNIAGYLYTNAGDDS